MALFGPDGPTGYPADAVVPAVAFGPWVVAPAAAAPIGLPLTLQQTVGQSAETIQYRRGRYGGYHGGAGIGLGIAGALIGGSIIGAATQPYGYYGYPPVISMRESRACDAL